MLLYGVVSAHPPIFLPEIGGDQLSVVKKSISALKRCGEQIKKLKIESILIISPHTDHGFSVPLYYLKDDVPEKNIRRILVGGEDYSWYFNYGKEAGEELEGDDERWAIIASGDLSHALKSDGPYQFHPNGPKLDALIQSAFKKMDAKVLLDLDRGFIADAAECGLRSILFLLGALSMKNMKTVKSRVLSYEGPWGVGYMIADIRLV
jgi:aromatic ring-opening dioxygenase LigB subunit